MYSLRKRLLKRQTGFSLVELMVGLAIGLLAVLIMGQTATFFEGQKRGISGGADAQNTGMVATYTLESDLRQAGYGLSTLDSLYCTFQTAGGFNGRPYVPVMIIPDGLSRSDAKNVLGIPPGDAGSDIVAVTYSNTVSTPEGVAVAATPNATTYQFSKNTTGFNANDYVLVSQTGQPCTLAKVAAVDTTTHQITVDHSSAGATYAVNNAKVVNLGAAGLTMHIYAIRNGSLTMCDAWANDCSADITSMASTARDALWVPIAANVVGLRAQYGWDITGAPDMGVDAYCRSRPKSDGTAWSAITNSSASPACPATDNGTTLPNVPCDWTRIVTFRFALVARSEERASEGINVSSATIALWPSSDPASTGPTSVGPQFSVPSQQFRYKVFQSTVPFRNVIWHGAQSSCT